MHFKLNTLPNSLRVLTIPVPTLESVTVTIWIGTGSRFETAKNSGISHFLEHMVFKGSKKRPTAKDIAEAVDSIGGEFNAATSKEWTNFYIKTRNTNLDTAFDVLSDMVLNPLIKEEDLAREKGVIVEEIGMYEDTPLWKVPDLFENLIFKGNELERDIIGTRKTVKEMAKNDFDLYRKSHYGSNNIVVTVAGGVTEKKVNELAKKYFGGLKKTNKRKINEFTSKQEKPQVFLSSKKKEQAHFILGFLSSKRDTKDRFAQQILTTVLGGGMSSRLFTEIREKRGLAYAVKASSEKYLDTGYIEVYAGVDPKRIDEAIKVTLDEVYKVANDKNPITPKELKKAKEYIKGHVALSLEDTKSINSFFGIRKLLLDKIETPEQIYKAIDKVTAKEVLTVAKKRFLPETLNLAIIGPYKDKERFEKLLK